LLGTRFFWEHRCTPSLNILAQNTRTSEDTVCSNYIPPRSTRLRSSTGRAISFRKNSWRISSRY
jgi:hypothetical protein